MKGQEMLTITQAAEYLGVTRQTVYTWLSRDILVPIEIGGITFLDKKQLAPHKRVRRKKTS
jgi:excisionase family DNA binding protein